MLTIAGLGVSLAIASSSPLLQEPDDLLALSLEQLGDVEVTATSRRASRPADTPASVHVIGVGQIRALGICTLPEALRLAPNLHVARINASGYAVSARGMKTSLSNKMLVLIDGRPIYTPLFAGVLWDMQDVAMADVERIEVVSGPGAAAWGANAVNGVINIVTRSARESPGGYATAWAGGDGRGFEAGQTVAAGADGAMRLYGKRREQDPSTDAPRARDRGRVDPGPGRIPRRLDARRFGAARAGRCLPRAGRRARLRHAARRGLQPDGALDARRVERIAVDRARLLRPRASQRLTRHRRSDGHRLARAGARDDARRASPDLGPGLSACARPQLARPARAAAA
jgi:outer membrane receptor protein involved in Fe transport